MGGGEGGGEGEKVEGRVVKRGKRWGKGGMEGGKVGAGNLTMDYHPIQGGVVILLVASCYGNRDLRSPMHRQNKAIDH